MRKFLRRIKNLFLVLLFLAIVLPLVYIVWHFYNGGTTRELFDDAKQAQSQAEALYERLDEIRENPDSILNEIKETVNTGINRRVVTDGPVTVCFAPTSRTSPWGIDDALVSLIQNATQSIDAAFYELQLPSVADALIARKAAGVAVRIVSDSDYQNRDSVQRCIAAGIAVVFDERNAFMHNKFCVIDNRVVWTGSTNITENGMYRNNNNALQIEIPEVAKAYSGEFEEMFIKQAFGGRSSTDNTPPMLVTDELGLEIYFAPEDNVGNEIIAELEQATTSIDFMAFAFTSRPIAEAMAKRIQSGVTVRGVFESRNASNQYSRDEWLEEKGAKVYLDTNTYTMHHKCIIIDNKTVITGSYNFSASADTKNDENVIILHSDTLAAVYTDEFEGLIAAE